MQTEGTSKHLVDLITVRVHEQKVCSIQYGEKLVFRFFLWRHTSVTPTRSLVTKTEELVCRAVQIGFSSSYLCSLPAVDVVNGDNHSPG